MKVIIYTAVVIVVSIYGYEKFYKPRFGKKNKIENNKNINEIMLRVEKYLQELTGNKIDKQDIKNAVLELFETK
tara:strand:+ start:12530 stop:12751 length:222 start_codon:yes stop_codon:yes gene_type:complete